MSWHFLQGGAGAFWEGASLDGAPDALLSLIPSHGRYCSPDNETDTSNDSRSGTTSARSTVDRGADPLTSSVVDSLVRTSAPLVLKPDSTASDLDSGWKWLGSFARWDRVTSSWKTRQLSLIADSESSLEIWPLSGLMLSGECLEPGALGHRTYATDCGLLQAPCAPKGAPIPKLSQWRLETRQALPTPTASARAGYNQSLGVNPVIRPSIEMMAREDGGHLSLDWRDWLMGWPIGWSALEPMVMGRFPQWLRLHGA